MKKANPPIHAEASHSQGDSTTGERKVATRNAVDSNMGKSRITLTQHNGVHRLDSRLLAKQLGNQHKSQQQSELRSEIRSHLGRFSGDCWDRYKQAICWQERPVRTLRMKNATDKRHYYKVLDCAGEVRSDTGGVSPANLLKLRYSESFPACNRLVVYLGKMGLHNGTSDTIQQLNIALPHANFQLDRQRFIDHGKSRFCKEYSYFWLHCDAPEDAHLDARTLIKASPSAINKELRLKNETRSSDFSYNDETKKACNCIAVPSLTECIAKQLHSRYDSPVAANSASGCGSPTTYRTQTRPISIVGAFFTPAMSIYGGCTWGTFECAGVLYARSSTPAHNCRLLRGSNAGSSSHTGAVPMTTLNPSALRALAHRRMALSALRADSSLAVRLKRYNAHMAIVRTLECTGGAQ